MPPVYYFGHQRDFDAQPQHVRLVPELGTRVLVAKTTEGWFACVARCPHGDIELGDRPLRDTRLTCSGHGYQFDLKTGMCTHTRHLRLAMLRVALVGDDILVGISLTPDAD